MVVRTFTEFLNMMTIEKAYNAKHGGELVRWRPVPYSHAEAVREIREAIAAGGGSSAAIPFKDGRLPSHTEADNAHHGSYGIAQRRAEYFQLLGLDSMHIMLVKALESQLATVLKRVHRRRSSRPLSPTRPRRSTQLCRQRPRRYDDNIDKTTDPPTKGVGGAPISYTFAAPGTAALRVLDNRFDANGPFSAIMLLVKAGRVGADSTSLESSLQAVADYDTEVRLFFTLPDGTLDRAEMDRAKGLADVLLAVPAIEVVLFDTLTDMIANHSPMAKTAVRLRQYINDRRSSFGLRPGMKQEAYMAQTQGPMAMSAQHMPMPMYSPAGFVSMSGAQGYHAPQPVQQPSHAAQYAPQPMQQAHMVQQAHDMQRALQGYDFDGDDFVDAFGAAQRRRVQCSNCNTYETMPEPPRDYVPHDTLDCQQKCNMCKMAAPRHLGRPTAIVAASGSMAGSVGSSRGPCGCHRSASRSSSRGRARVARPTTVSAGSPVLARPAVCPACARVPRRPSSAGWPISTWSLLGWPRRRSAASTIRPSLRRSTHATTRPSICARSTCTWPTRPERAPD